MIPANVTLPKIDFLVDRSEGASFWLYAIVEKFFRVKKFLFLMRASHKFGERTLNSKKFADFFFIYAN